MKAIYTDPTPHIIICGRYMTVSGARQVEKLTMQDSWNKAILKNVSEHYELTTRAKNSEIFKLVKIHRSNSTLQLKKYCSFQY